MENKVYNQVQFKKDQEFANELLERFGLRDFTTIYKPKNKRSLWTYWNTELEDHVIRQEFDRIQEFNELLKINYDYNDINDEFERIYPILIEVLNWMYGYKQYTEREIFRIFMYIQNSSDMSFEFKKWLDRKLTTTNKEEE